MIAAGLRVEVAVADHDRRDAGVARGLQGRREPLGLRGVARARGDIGFGEGARRIVDHDHPDGALGADGVEGVVLAGLPTRGAAPGSAAAALTPAGGAP